MARPHFDLDILFFGNHNIRYYEYPPFPKHGHPCDALDESKRDFDQALKDFTAAVAIDPNFDWALYDRAEVYSYKAIWRTLWPT